MRGRRRSGRSGPRRAPVRVRPIRRGQLISPFGVGAITDFRNDEALMCAGLDMWFRAPPEADLRIAEERLQQRLDCDFFVNPPEFSESETTARHKIPHVRFPLWHYCPRCFQMKRASLFGEQPRCENTVCSPRRIQRRMIPVRVIAVCEKGHIEDFPFREWIGCQCADEYASRLFFKAGRSAASLAGIKIECQGCGRIRSLAGAFEEDALSKIGVSCSGAQPWLGRERGLESCSAQLQTLQRGGSNVYFPLVTSSIYIPPTNLKETEAIQRVLDNPSAWFAISSEIIDGRINDTACRTVASMFQVDPKQLAAAAQARLDGQDRVMTALTEEDFRRQEYEILSSGSGTPLDELFTEQLDGAKYGWLARYVRRVGLVRKLRETRVLVGFSRLLPRTECGEEGVQSLAIDPDMRWLPAIEVRGEGIFVELRQDTIDRWLTQVATLQRTADLIREYNLRRAVRQLAVRNVDARFMMLHTLAHAVIKELTFSCGYGSAALRERLYCDLEDPDRPMSGFLVYTASGDSEGTLGGLVAQAQPGRFERMVGDALRHSSWCSNDPVCMESPGSGSFSSNLAACHGCVLLPETSCEEGNRLLDRGLLVGTVEEPGIGLFGGDPCIGAA
jgi:Domain of unknown function (DUF1998)